MEPEVTQYIRERKDIIFSRWMDQMNQEAARAKDDISYKTMELANENFIDIIYTYLSNDENPTDVDDFVTRILQFGWPITYLTRGFQISRRVLLEIMNEEKHSDTVNLLKVCQHADAMIEPIFSRLVKDVAQKWEHTVAMQKTALMELSAPLIPVMRNISIMPLIGTIDTERAKLIMENLLQGVIDHHAEVVLIDITGVPVVDTMVAHHIIQASEAVKLVGAECILVGIRPEIAQTIIHLGIELGELKTKSSLQKGIQTALAMTKRKIVDATDRGGAD